MRACVLLFAVVATFQSTILAANTDRRISEINISKFNNSNSKNSDSDNSENNKFNNFQAKEHQNTLLKIKNKLLTVLQLKSPPKTDNLKIFIPDAMKNLYRQVTEYEHSTVTHMNPALYTHDANTVRSLTGEGYDQSNYHHGKFILHFKLGSLPAEEILKAAELCISRDSIIFDNSKETMYQILVYDILSVRTKIKSEPNYLLVSNKSVWLNSSETIILDVKSAVNRWLLSPKENQGLLIEFQIQKEFAPILHKHVRLKRSAQETNEEWSHKQPLILLYTDDGRSKVNLIDDLNDFNRPKRANPQKTYRRKNGQEVCQRRSMYVSFNEIGLSDWIVAPEGYDAFYCHGDCPFPLADHLNSTNHAVVQTLINNINPGSVPKASCAPTELGSMSVLYLDSKKQPVVKTVEDMVVVNCGCR